MSDDHTIRSLRAALEVSPDNFPLRRHLADTLMSARQYHDAVQEYRHLLSQTPGNVELKSCLAEAYYKLGNASAAFVIVEELVKSPHPAGAVYLLHSRLLLDSDEPDRAARAYRKAAEADPAATDAALAGRLSLDTRTGRDIASANDDYEDEVDDLGRIRANAGASRGAEFDTAIERPTISFADVGGMDELKEEIRMKILHPLTHPELYKAYGKAIGGGILMYGPPGCGKTYLARATAGEVKASFLAVGINDVLDMWLGNSEKNLHELFATARRNAPCVLFFDEVDALGASRSDMRTSSSKMLINQFLSELDGVKNSNDGVLILGATNAPWHLDSAFRRPGRFERVLFVPPPDAAARSEILSLQLKGKPVADVDFSALADKTRNFSGADLQAVVNLAIERKLKDAFRSGQPLPITTKDLLSGIKTHKPTTLEWFATAKNYALYSNQGGVYDDILSWLRIK